MKFREQRILRIKASSYYWCEYHWDHGSELWCYYTSNEGFFEEYNLPSKFSQAERLLLEIKLSEATL